MGFRSGFGMGFSGMGIFHFGLDQKVPADRGFLKIWEFLLNPGDLGFLSLGFFGNRDFFRVMGYDIPDIPPKSHLCLRYSNYEIGSFFVGLFPAKSHLKNI